MHDSCMTPLSRQGTVTGAKTRIRFFPAKEGDFTPNDRAIAERLYPHLGTAIRRVATNQNEREAREEDQMGRAYPSQVCTLASGAP